MQSIYIHIYIYTNFESKTCATKKTEIIHPSSFVESIATRWAVRSSDLRHSGFLHLRSIILQLDGSILSQLSTGKDPADVLKTVMPLWLFLFVKGRFWFWGLFFLRFSWFLWSCVDLGRCFFWLWIVSEMIGWMFGKVIARLKFAFFGEFAWYIYWLWWFVVEFVRLLRYVFCWWTCFASCLFLWWNVFGLFYFCVHLICLSLKSVSGAFCWSILLGSCSACFPSTPFHCHGGVKSPLRCRRKIVRVYSTNSYKVWRVFQGYTVYRMD